MRRALMSAACVLMLAACQSGYDEDAHREAAAEFADDGVEVDEEVWQQVREVAEDTCASEEEAFAIATAMTADESGERGMEFRRMNIEHMCPDRLAEFDEIAEGLEY